MEFSVTSTLSARQLESLLGEWHALGSAYEALAQRIRLLIIDGRIAPQTRLPSERELADRLGRSRTTVVSAYGRLREQGYLSSVRGSGSVVRMPQAGGTDDAVGAPDLIDFAKATPLALPSLPVYVQRAAAKLTAVLGLSGVDHVGLPMLRQAIARRYIERGLPTSADQVVVTVGAQQAIGLLARTLLTRGDRVVTEAPTYPHAYEALRIAGGRMVGLTVTSDGWDEERLVEVLERTRPSLAYVIPDFQNPTGASMPPELRASLIRTAVRTGTVVIADETTAELDIDRPWSALPFAAYAQTPEERASVIMLGSVGKTVWGGIRLGWIRAEKPHIDRILAARPAMDMGTPLLEQLIVTELLADMPAILEFRSRQLREGRDLLVSLLAEQLPEWDVTPAAGGICLWAGLGAPVSSALALAARSFGLQIIAGPRFAGDGAFERFIRVPFTFGDDDLRAGVAALAAAWRSLGRLPALPAAGDLAQVV